MSSQDKPLTQVPKDPAERRRGAGSEPGRHLPSGSGSGESSERGGLWGTRTGALSSLERLGSALVRGDSQVTLTLKVKPSVTFTGETFCLG